MTTTHAAEPSAGTAARGSSTGADGRSTRWDAHRRARREELVHAALRAITRYGPAVGVDEIAAEAGTSKTALYRHFSDKEQLYLAVAETVSRRILTDLAAAGAAHERPRSALGAVIATYLRLVADDPDVYWFVTHLPASSSGTSGTASAGGASDPLAGLTSAVSSEIAAAIARRLVDGGVDARTAEPWSHALVGMVRSAADHWMRTRSLPSADGARPATADELAAQLTALAWGGLSRAPVDRPVEPEPPPEPAPQPQQPVEDEERS